jgi:copper(I)-binding protein
MPSKIVALALSLTTVMAFTAAAEAADVTAGSLSIAQPWTRATPPGAKVAGGFMTITNNGKEADKLVGGSAAFAGHIEVHEMSMDGGVMKMRELANGLEIKPGQSVVLKPGSFHVMFMELKGPVAEGAPVKGTLKFEKAGSVDVAYEVAPLGAKSLDDKGSTAAGKGGHNGHH